MLSLAKKKFPIGIDISDLSLKLISLYQRGDKIYIEALGRIELPPGTVQGGEIKRTDLFVEKMKLLIADPLYGSISLDEVYACLPENKTFIKLIDIGKNPNNIDELVLHELENNIPVPASEIYWDWQYIESDTDHKYILVGAAPRNIADQYVDLFKQSGLTIIGMELESISTARALMVEENPLIPTPPPTTYAVIDVGAKRTSMFIYSKNTIVYSISLPISSEEATLKIADTMNIDINQAEKAKLVCGFDPDKADGVVREILLALVDKLVAKIQDLMKFQSHHYPGFPPISKVLLAGSGVNIEKFDEILAEKLGIVVAKGAVNVNLAETQEKFHEIFGQAQALIAKQKKAKTGIYIENDISVNFATAIGLALRPVFEAAKRK